MTATDRRATAADGWWSAEHIDELTALLARQPSRVPQFNAPADLAEWVFAVPEPAPLTPAPAPFNGDWTIGLDAPQRGAWALAGWTIRMTVPQPAFTSGKQWLLSRVDEGSGPLLRLTVGTLETLAAYESGEGVWLRVAAAPITLAMNAGAVDLEEWGRHGIAVLKDRSRSLAAEKLLLSCPDLDTAFWLLRQSPVIAAARVLNARAATGPSTSHGRYRPDLAARAWIAAQTLLDAEAGSCSRADVADLGFDRPYGGAVLAAVPGQRSRERHVSRDGTRKHERLCRQLVDHLSRDGVQAGAGLYGLPVDLAWQDAGSRQFIALVKSAASGDTDQLRLGLGQILEYRQRLARRGVPVTAVLLMDGDADALWRDVCADSGVTLLGAADEPAWSVLLGADGSATTRRDAERSVSAR